MYYKRINKRDYYYKNSPISLQNSYDNLKGEDGVIISSDKNGEFLLVPSSMVDEFVITAVSRQDVISIGYHAENLSDSDMEAIAESMSQNYTEYGDYWDSLENECEEMGLTKDESLIDNENEEED